MKYTKQPYQTINQLVTRFDTALDAYGTWSQWHRPFGAECWERKRTLNHNKIMTTVFQIMSRPIQDVRDECPDPEYILGQSKGTAYYRADLTQKEYRWKKLFSRYPGKLALRQWHLSTSTEPKNIPTMSQRALTDYEQVEYSEKGGSYSYITSDAPEATNLVLAYKNPGWHIREGDVQGPSFSADSQIGRLVIAGMNDAADIFLTGL